MSALEAPQEPFSITIVPNRREVTVIATGEIDLSTAGALESQVRELRTSGFDQIVVDLRGVGFLDSAGLRTLLTLRNDAKREGHGFSVVPGPRVVQRVFEITATTGLFDWRRP